MIIKLDRGNVQILPAPSGVIVKHRQAGRRGPADAALYLAGFTGKRGMVADVVGEDLAALAVLTAAENDGGIRVEGTVAEPLVSTAAHPDFGRELVEEGMGEFIGAIACFHI